MASNVKPHQRAFALTIAIIFLVTTVATSVFVIMSIVNEDDQRAVIDQNSTSVSSDSPAQNNPNALQGTQLANFSPVNAVDTLQITDLKEGTGEVVPAGASVTAHYSGAVASTGTIFQSSYDGGQPIPFSLNGVIKGWTDGVPGMKVGGIRRLVIPADQAYGANPPAGSGIPANAPLVFDIELVSINKE